MAQAPWQDRTSELTTSDLNLQDNGGGTAPSAQPRELAIDPARAAQQIAGFGGCFNELGWQALSKLSDSDRQAVLAALVTPDGCNFNICRMPIGANDYALDYYSLDDTDGDYNLDHFSLDRDRRMLIPYIKATMALRPDLQMWGSPWTAPAWLKTNKQYNNGSLVWDDQHRATYARYLAKAAQAFRQEGLNFFAVFVQNEPASGQSNYPTCNWTGTQLRDFIRDNAGPVFRQQNVAAQIWLGTMNTSDVPGFFLPTLNDPAAAAFVGGVGVQWDGKGAVAEIHQRFPKLSLMQTETECGDGHNDWGYAEYTFSLFKLYFEAGVNSYMQWNMVLDETGLSHWGWRQSAMITIDRAAGRAIYNPQFYLVKHLSHFVKPGARRIGLAGGENVLAFENPDQSAVVTWVNVDGTEKPVRLTYNGHSVGATLPAKSFNTFVLR